MHFFRLTFFTLPRSKELEELLATVYLKLGFVRALLALRCTTFVSEKGKLRVPWLTEDFFAVGRRLLMAMTFCENCSGPSEKTGYSV